jgi:hypothetical protein
MLTIDLGPNEHVLKIARRHWIAIVGRIIAFLAMTLIPLFAYWVIALSFPNLPWVESTAIALFLYGLWLLFGWIGLFYSWTNYYLDIWIITTLRIFAIDQKTLFAREVSSFTFDKIQDLTIDITGILATFLKFGKISIETASEKRYFVFSNANDPENIKKIINDAQNDYQATF